jgi:hypothetical protein
MPAAIPSVEAADDADFSSIGRPHGESGAIYAVDRHGMRAQLFKSAQMCPLDE